MPSWQADLYFTGTTLAAVFMGLIAFQTRHKSSASRPVRTASLCVAAALLLISMVSLVLRRFTTLPLQFLLFACFLLLLSCLVLILLLFSTRIENELSLVYQNLARNSEDAIIILDGQGEVIDLNPAAQQILNIRPSQARLVSLEGISPAVQKGLEQSLRDPTTPVYLEIPQQDQKRAYSLKSFPIDEQPGLAKGIALVLRDVSEIQRLATTDPLTGLNNRRFFIVLGRRELDRARRYHRAISAILFDIDHLKNVNDKHGPATGDHVLQVLGKRCQNAFRHTDILGRYGGEEFAVLLPETNPDFAMQTAERFRQLIELKSFETSAGMIAITISVGVAGQTDCQDLTLDVLLAQADQALSAAKAGGGNQIKMAVSAEEISGE